MHKWAHLNPVNKFLKQNEIKDEINDSNQALSACFESLSVPICDHSIISMNLTTSLS
jgi:hypothetical protein